MNRRRNLAVAAGAVALGGLLGLRAVRRATHRLDFRDRVVVITGGSRGLGLLIARQLADEGAVLVIAARDADELERVRGDLADRGARVRLVPCDVGVREEAERLVHDTLEREGRIDVLVNNAGIITVGPLEHMAHGDFEQAMAVHFWGPLHTTLAALPAMRRQGGGRVVNISSIGGKIGVPHLTPYCASKFALAGLSDSMRSELAKDNILVTTVFPGLMRTGSPFNAWFKGNHRDEFTWFTLADSIPVASIDGRRAASQIVDAVRHGDAELIVSLTARLATIANALSPDLVAFVMAGANTALLPPPAEDPGTEAHSGWQSLSPWAPSRLTRMTERAARDNNELPAS